MRKGAKKKNVHWFSRAGWSPPSFIFRSTVLSHLCNSGLTIEKLLPPALKLEAKIHSTSPVIYEISSLDHSLSICVSQSQPRPFHQQRLSTLLLHFSHASSMLQQEVLSLPPFPYLWLTETPSGHLRDLYSLDCSFTVILFLLQYSGINVYLCNSITYTCRNTCASLICGS